MNVIDAIMFRAMLHSGAMDLQRHCDEVNSLNVFPVPDGDTGVNMLATIRGGVEAIDRVTGSSLGEASKALSHGMLLAARGNSGVILSQFFTGMADGLSQLDTANVLQFGQAFESGVKRAYEVVVKPVEGTILTVMREGCEAALARVDSSTTYEEYFTVLLKKMRKTLKATPDLLPVLKEAGVIDSGGAGLLYIIEGMGQALGGKIIEDVSLNLSPRHSDNLPDTSAFNEDSTLDYGYCTEFILQLTNGKNGVKNFDLDQAIAYLSSIGDSLVAFRDGTLVKVHVHTKCPDKAIAYALKFGEFVRFKMENMTLQHHQTLVDKSRDISMMAKPEKPKKPIAVVAVSPTKELDEVFKNYGVDVTIDVGPFMNPGAEDFIHAFRQANADALIVFPNNKNEIMVAEMAIEMDSFQNVHVIPTGDVAEGLSCCSVIDTADLDLEENLSRIEATMNTSKTLAIFRAVHDSSLFGVTIKKGEYVWTSGEEVHRSESVLDAFRQWYEPQADEGHSLLTLLCSETVADIDFDQIQALVEDKDPFLDLERINSGKCLYNLYAILD